MILDEVIEEEVIFWCYSKEMEKYRKDPFPMFAYEDFEDTLIIIERHPNAIFFYAKPSEVDERWVVNNG